jgi:hypothetical protein
MRPPAIRRYRCAGSSRLQEAGITMVLVAVAMVAILAMAALSIRRGHSLSGQRGGTTLRRCGCPRGCENSSSGCVVQPVRTLLSNRHIDVSNLKISNLTPIASGRPVTVPSTFPAFPEAWCPREYSKSRTSENGGCCTGVSLNPRPLWPIAGRE